MLPLLGVYLQFKTMLKKRQAELAKLENLPSPASVSDVTIDNFNEKINQSYQPLILKNFAADWEIVKKSQQSLALAAEYLKGFDHQQKLKLISLPEDTLGRLFYNHDLSGKNFTVKNSTLSDSIDLMLEKDNKTRYCLQSVSLKQNYPELIAQLPNKLLPNTQSFIWIGNKVTVPAHFDEANNIAVVAAGKRRFTLFQPEQIKNLYIGPLDFTPAGQPISLVNLRAPDLSQFPLYEQAYANALSVELEAGDAIYIPTPWWHHVESLSPFNVLINYWWSDNYVSSQLPFPMLIHALQAFKNMPIDQQQAWQSIMQHYLFNQDESAIAHIPKAAQGILGEQAKPVSHFIHQWLASQIK